MNRRHFLKRSAWAAALLARQRPASSAQSASDLSNREILAQTDARIDQHRRGAGVITVRGTDGQPIPGAAVKIEQLRHEFLFGCNFFMFGRIGDAALQEAYNQRFAALFNYATLGFYWPYYEPRRGEPIYDYTDNVAAWCAKHGVTCKGHPLVWDYADPAWLPKDFTQIEALSKERVGQIVSRYRGRIEIWDVVNEPTHLGRFKTRFGEWALSKGAVPYVAEHLKLARLANPKATLLVNDYRTDPPYYQILDALREKDQLLFDTIGIQSHMHDGSWPLQRVWEVCDRFARLEVPLHFTETTVVSGPRKGPGENWGGTTPEGEAAQAAAVPQFYATLFAHPAVRGITWWDFSDRGAWQGAAAGWVRKDMSPKPVYERMLDLIKRQWWTNSQGNTDGSGQFKVRAFFGEHRVTAELPRGVVLTQKVHWKPGADNSFELKAG